MHARCREKGCSERGSLFLSKSAMLRKPDGWGESDLGKNKQSQDDTCQQNTKG